jgi:hypothetical protein
MVERGLNDLAKVDIGSDPIIPANVIEQKRKAAGLDGGSHTAEVAADEAWLAGLPARITSIANGADALALSTELRNRPKALPGSQSELRGDLYQLQNDLNSLGQFAAACEQGRFNFSLLQLAEPSRHRWQKQTSEVRARFARQALASQLGAPEIMRAPLEAAALEKAVLQLADEAAKKREWRKVYDMLRVCNGAGDRFGSGRDPIGDEIGGIADFFTGQRFEKAEQWAEAITSYQNVLRRMGNRLPVAEATERLQALKREHPEAFAVAEKHPSPMGNVR